MLTQFYILECDLHDQSNQAKNQSAGYIQITAGAVPGCAMRLDDGLIDFTEQGVLFHDPEPCHSAEGGTEGSVTVNSGKDERDIGTVRTETGGTTGSGTSETSRDLDESGSKSHNVSGYDGIAPADLLMRWRETFLNIDMQVISSLETLFLGLWM